MKTSVLSVGMLLISINAFGKCWSLTELPPTYCAVVFIEKINAGEECSISAKPISYSIPRADLQNVRWSDSLKDKGRITIKVSRDVCARLKVGDSLKGVIRATCSDKSPAEAKEFVFYSLQNLPKFFNGVHPENWRVFPKSFMTG